MTSSELSFLQVISQLLEDSMSCMKAKKVKVREVSFSSYVETIIRFSCHIAKTDK